MEITTLKLPCGIINEKETQEIFVTYLTTKAELNLFNLTAEDSLIYEYLIENIIVNKEKINTNRFLLSDLFTLMLFSFSTSYGDTINFKLICSECEKESEVDLKISEDINFDFESFRKAQKELISFEGASFKLQPITFNTLKIMNYKLKDINYNSHEFVSLHLNFYEQEEINSIYNDRILFSEEIQPRRFIEEKKEIKEIIKFMPINQYKKLKELVKDIDVRIFPIKRKCVYCGFENELNIDYNINLFKFEENFKEGILTEIFFLLQNMTNINYNDIMEMPVYIRKWFVKKTIEYIEKIKEEEKKGIPSTSYFSKANSLLNKIKI